MIRALPWVLCAGIAVAKLFLPDAAEAVVPIRESQPALEQPTGSFLTGDIGVNFVSKYLLAGIVYENQGMIAQPYADVIFRLHEGEGFVTKVSLAMGFASSVQSNKTLAPLESSVPEWFEQDYKPVLSVTFAKNFTLATTYCFFSSPSGAFPTARALKWRLDINDADLLGAFALHPHFTYLREMEKKVGNGSSQGNYYEMGIAPALPRLGPVLLTLPMTVGFGTEQFYVGNEGFGYFSGGVNLAVPIKCIPAGYGKWTVNAGVTYYYVHGALAKPNALRGSNHNDFVFNGGVGMEF